MKCKYCGTEPNNATTKKGLYVCCCYMLHLQNGKYTQHHRDKCVICGAELPMNITQITFATKDKGVESACMKHEFSSELKTYTKENGGIIPILEAITDHPTEKGGVQE